MHTSNLDEASNYILIFYEFHVKFVYHTNSFSELMIKIEVLNGYLKYNVNIK